MTALERRFRWLLHAYPAWYRRERAGEMLDTLLEASPPGRRWPSIRDSRALVVGGPATRLTERSPGRTSATFGMGSAAMS